MPFWRGGFDSGGFWTGSSMTYTTFKSDIDAMLARDDVGGGVDIDLLVRLAEVDLNRRVYGVVQLKTMELSVNAMFVYAPTDYRSAVALSLDQNNDRTISYMTPEVIRNSPAWQSSSQPAYYTIETDGDGNIRFTFAPGGDPVNPTPCFLHYWAGLASIITNDTNALIVTAYDLYLYRTLEAAGNYLQEPEIETRYASLFEKALGEYNLSEQRKRFGGNAKIAMNTQRTIV